MGSDSYALVAGLLDAEFDAESPPKRLTRSVVVIVGGVGGAQRTDACLAEIGEGEGVVADHR